jgi:hypothetical protein
MCLFTISSALFADHASMLRFTEINDSAIRKKGTDVFLLLSFSNHGVFLMEQVVQIMSTRLKLHT